MSHAGDCGRGAPSAADRAALANADQQMLAALVAQVTAAALDIAGAADQHGRIEIRLARDRGGAWHIKVEGGPHRQY